MKCIAVTPFLCLAISIVLTPTAAFKLIKSTNSRNPCVANEYLKEFLGLSVLVRECRRTSFSCLWTIADHGYAKCKAVFEVIEVKSQKSLNHSVQVVKEKIVVDCTCA
ncbi:uncharacterized protein [Montipora foliosa]|uniref:uncharacterized protein n=1 Tax=Montipora foliosa TaxID=591990 RepID=UPI0035F20CF4